ncbi:hypothetical protein Tco_0468678 [Tanacetum coccineum]
MSVQELLLQEKLHKALQAVCEKLNQQEQAANVSTHTPKPTRRFNFIYDDDDDDEESVICLFVDYSVTFSNPFFDANDDECFNPGGDIDEIDLSNFGCDQITKKSSGQYNYHADFSLLEYDSFIFNLSIDPFPHADKSVSHHEEFTDELAHIIFPPEYDRFYFDLEIVPGRVHRVFWRKIY